MVTRGKSEHEQIQTYLKELKLKLQLKYTTLPRVLYSQQGFLRRNKNERKQSVPPHSAYPLRMHPPLLCTPNHTPQAPWAGSGHHWRVLLQPITQCPVAPSTVTVSDTLEWTGGNPTPHIALLSLDPPTLKPLFTFAFLHTFHFGASRGRGKNPPETHF